MLPTTLKAADALFQTDATIGPSERRRLMTLLRNDAPKLESSGPSADRVLRIPEAANLVGRTPRALHNWAKAGVLAKVRLPGSKRALGFRESDVQNLIAGKAPAAVPSTEAA